MSNISGGPGIEVDGPSCEKPRYGLLSVAEVEDRIAGHWMDGFYHEQLSCEEDLLVVSQFCEPHIKEASAAGFNNRNSDPFALVGGYKCSTAGDTLAIAWDRAEQRLDQGESRSVEKTFWTGLDSLGNPLRETLGQNIDVVDLSAGAVDITTGLALLEEWAGQNMDCQPIIHVGTAIGTYMAERNLMTQMGRNLRTNAKYSRVANGGGYGRTGPMGVAPGPGEAWMFVSGSVKILRAPIFFNPPRDDPDAAVNRKINDVTVFAEREYGFAVECGMAATLVTLDACCPTAPAALAERGSDASQEPATEAEEPEAPAAA